MASGVEMNKLQTYQYSWPGDTGQCYIRFTFLLMVWGLLLLPLWYKGFHGTPSFLGRVGDEVFDPGEKFALCRSVVGIVGKSSYGKSKYLAKVLNCLNNIIMVEMDG